MNVDLSADMVEVSVLFAWASVPWSAVSGRRRQGSGPDVFDVYGVTLLSGYAGTGKSTWLRQVHRQWPSARLWGERDRPPDLADPGLLLAWTVRAPEVWLLDDPTVFWVGEESHWPPPLAVQDVARLRSLRDLGHGVVLTAQTFAGVGAKPGLIGIGSAVPYEMAADRYVLFRADVQDLPLPVRRDFPEAARWISRLAVGEWAVWVPGSAPSFHRWPRSEQ